MVSSNSFVVTCNDGVLNGFYIYELGSVYRVSYGSFSNSVVIGSGSFASTKRHIACTLIGTEFKIYVDSTLVSTQTLTVLSASTYKCSLLYSKYSGTFHYDGWTDTPQFLNNGLNATEIAGLYNSGSGIQYP